MTSTISSGRAGFGAAVGLSAALLFFATPASAGTVSVKCSTARLQAAIDAAPAAVPTTINLAGVCVENILVPQGKVVTIVGAVGAGIRPKDTTKPAVDNYGMTSLVKLTISSTAAGADALVQSQSARLEIIASTINGPNASGVLGVAGGGLLRLVNSTVTGGVDNAIWVASGGTLYASAAPDETTGPAGAVTTISSGNGSGPAIWCGPSGNVRIGTFVNGTTAGIVRVRNSAAGLSLNGCIAEIRNRSSDPANLVIAGNKGHGIVGSGSQIFLRGVKVFSNTLEGINVVMSNVQIFNARFEKNGGDILAGMRSEILFNWNSASVLPDINTGSGSLRCMDNSEISIPSGTVSPVPGSLYDSVACVRKY